MPSGKVGKAFVQELARLFSAYSDRSAMECFSLKAAMVLPVLVLQKPHQRSKAKDHVAHLERRLKLWSKGSINELILEGRTIQQQLTSKNRNSATSESQTSRAFAKLMMEGKVRAALRLISKTDANGSLSLNDEIRDSLRKKHPTKQPPVPSAIIESNEPPKEPHFILFEQIDGQLIRETALRTEGAAGPSGLDAAAWKRLCSSFGSTSVELCDAIASVTRRICTSYVDPNGLSALVACRLIDCH